MCGSSILPGGANGNTLQVAAIPKAHRGAHRGRVQASCSPDGSAVARFVRCLRSLGPLPTAQSQAPFSSRTGRKGESGSRPISGRTDGRSARRSGRLGSAVRAPAPPVERSSSALAPGRSQAPSTSLPRKRRQPSTRCSRRNAPRRHRRGPELSTARSRMFWPPGSTTRSPSGA
jgi:hypothetical protein